MLTRAGKVTKAASPFETGRVDKIVWRRIRHREGLSPSAHALIRRYCSTRLSVDDAIARLLGP